MRDYRGKTVAITGGATGIGFALGKALGLEGARIIIGEPRQEKLDQATKAYRDLGIDSYSSVLDVTDLASMKAFADFAWNASDQIDVLINNAGIGLPPKRMMYADVAQIKRLFDVNLFGVWHGASVFGARMMEIERPAEIFNVASENAFFNAAPRMAAYIASKHDVRGLTEAMREDFPDFIQIGLIIPGLVASDMTKGLLSDRAMTADEFAGRIIPQMKAGAFYLVSHACNMERIQPVHEEIETAYASYAPRYDGDMELDVRHLIENTQKPS